MISIYKATMTSLRKFSFVIDQRHIRKSQSLSILRRDVQGKTLLNKRSEWDKQIQIKSSFLIKFLIVVDDDD